MLYREALPAPHSPALFNHMAHYQDPTSLETPVTPADIHRAFHDHSRLIEYRDKLITQLPSRRYLKIKPVDRAPDIFQPLTVSGTAIRDGSRGDMFYIFITHNHLHGVPGTIAHEFGHIAQDLESPRVNKTASPFAELDADVRAGVYGFGNVGNLQNWIRKLPTLARPVEPGAWLVQYHLYGDAEIKQRTLHDQQRANNRLFDLYRNSEWYDYPNNVVWPTADLVKARKDWDDWADLHPDV